MRFYQVFILVLCVLIVSVNFISDDANIEPIRGLLLNFDQSKLQTRFGDARGLSHNRTRGVYLQVLSEAQKTISNSRDSVERKAFTCSMMRHEARRYARSRDGTYGWHLTDAFLQLRDSYVHGLKYLVVALRKDYAASLALQKPTFYHVALVVKQTFNCLAPAFGSGECPSYTFLRVIRDKSDEEILGSCMVANKAYNSV